MIPRLLDIIQCKLFLRTNFTDYIKGNYLFGIFKIGFVVKVHFEIVFAVIFLFFVSWPEIFYVPLVLLVFYSNQLTILYIYIFLYCSTYLLLGSTFHCTQKLLLTNIIISYQFLFLLEIISLETFILHFFCKSFLWKSSFCSLIT